MKHYKSLAANVANPVGTLVARACPSQNLRSVSLVGSVGTQSAAYGFVEVAV